jgi:hypothetical protein
MILLHFIYIYYLLSLAFENVRTSYNFTYTENIYLENIPLNVITINSTFFNTTLFNSTH